MDANAYRWIQAPDACCNASSCMFAQRENIQKGSQNESLFFLSVVHIKALSPFLLLAPQGMRNKWWLLRAESHPSFFSGFDALENFG